jgi:hypothetical protein
VWRREWPITQVIRGQVLSGRIDLVVEQPQSLAVYDHKSFPGGHDRWVDEIAAHAPQSKACAEALKPPSGFLVSRMAIPRPIAGAVLVMEP